MSWSHDQVLTLIEAYKARPCLYNVKSASYKNKHMRTKSYEEIVQQIETIRPGTGIGEVKSKINGLRTNFLTEHRKHMRSFKSGMGEDAVYQPTLWYYMHMLFILDHTTPRRTIDSIEMAESQSESVEDNATTYYDEETDTTFQNDDSISIEYVEDSSESSSSTLISAAPKSKAVTQETPRKRRKINEDALITSANNAMQKIAHALDANSKVQHVEKQTDVDVFGAFVVSRLNMIKNKDILNNAQEEITKILFQSYKMDI